MQTAVVGGRTVRYLQSGDPSATRVLVLLHAFPLGARLFEPQLAAVPGWRVVAPALPGFDGSALLERAHVDDYARHVLRLLEGLGVPRAVFGGVSMGGYVVFGVLRQAASRVSAVVLADTRSGADAEEALAGRQRLAELVRAGGVRAVADDMIPKLLGDTTRRRQPDVAAAVRAMIEAQSTDGIAAAIDALRSRPDSTPLLNEVNVPALVMVGSEDRMTPPSEAQLMADALSSSTLVAIDGAGHLSNLEAPEAFNRALRTFLESVRAV